MSGQAVITIGDNEWYTDVANLPWELSQGLGGLPEIPPATGMLFDLGIEQTIEVTTVPMLFALDIAFLSEGLVVTEVYRNIEPGYLVTSQLPARYFLEVNASEFDDIAPGDEISVEFLTLEEVPATPDWLFTMFGMAGFLVLGTLAMSIARGSVVELLEEPEAKPGLLPETIKKPTRHDVIVDTWQERDRLGIWLTDRRNDSVIARWWDDDAREMFEQGFFKPGVPQRTTEKPSREFIESVLNYAESVGILAIDSSPAVVSESLRKPVSMGGLEFLPDSPEFLAYTIDDIGYREKIDSAFLGAIARSRGKKS